MRGFALVGLVAMLIGCGPDVAQEQETQAQGAPESWCNSYTTQQYCPRNVCFWDASRTPSCTSQGSTSVQAQGAPESWCNSYTTQQYCPKNICVWDASRTPSCTLPASSAQAQ